MSTELPREGGTQLVLILRAPITLERASVVKMELHSVNLTSSSVHPVPLRCIYWRRSMRRRHLRCRDLGER